MSIVNLLVPNSYNLYANSITTQSIVPSAQNIIVRTITDEIQIIANQTIDDILTTTIISSNPVKVEFMLNLWIDLEPANLCIIRIKRNGNEIFTSNISSINGVERYKFQTPILLSYVDISASGENIYSISVDVIGDVEVIINKINNNLRSQCVLTELNI